MKLHVVSFAIPWPANYGGVIDVFHKLRILKSLGVGVILHCWQYGGRKPWAGFEHLVDRVHYYPRNRLLNPFWGPIPYIIKTRQANELESNLMADDWPVLFEGIHTTAPLFYNRLPGKFTIVRTHNIERDYYQMLGHAERNVLKKMYLSRESVHLGRYERAVLEMANAVATISPNDQKILSDYCHSEYVPVFHAHDQSDTPHGEGEGFCLYQGNLQVAENVQAAKFLLDEVFSSLDVPFVLASNEFPEYLRKMARHMPHVEMVRAAEPSSYSSLIKRASVHVLPSFQPTGIKLKLLNALFQGRHCVINDPMVAHPVLANLCAVAHDAGTFAAAIADKMNTPWTEEQRVWRGQALMESFDNMESGRKLIALLP